MKKALLTFLFINTLVIAAWAQPEYVYTGDEVPTGFVEPNRLAQIITSNCKNDHQKAEAIYYWIAHNISYDYERYMELKKSKKKSKKKASDSEIKREKEKSVRRVLSQRSGVCQDYSNLYAELCSYVGLSSEIINGYAKSNPKKIGLGDKHAWNAVKLNGKWEFVDATWGAGYINNEKEFVQEYDPYLFLPNKEQFIVNHLPKDASWQMVKEPSTREIYKQNPITHQGYFKYDIQGFYPAENTIPFKEDGSIVVQLESEQEIKEFYNLDMKTGERKLLTHTYEKGVYSITVYGLTEKSRTITLEGDEVNIISYKVVME